jgi:hypothetical protein
MYNNDAMVVIKKQNIYAKVLILPMKMFHNVLFYFPCVIKLPLYNGVVTSNWVYATDTCIIKLELELNKYKRRKS